MATFPRNNVQVRIIQTIHIAFIGYIIFGPYLGPDHPGTRHRFIPFKSAFFEYATPWDTMYAATAFALLIHWYLNSDVCILTTLESIYRNGTIQNDSSEGFLKRVISPIYLIKDQVAKRLSYAVVLANLAFLFFFKYRNKEVLGFAEE